MCTAAAVGLLRARRFNRAHILGKGPPEIGHQPVLKHTFYEKNLTWQNPALVCRSGEGQELRAILRGSTNGHVHGRRG